jgi:hypothetical protein
MVWVQASLHFGPVGTDLGRPAAHASVGNYVVRPSDLVLISQLTQYGLRPVEVRLVSAKPPEPTLLPVVNKTSSLIVENVDEDRNDYKVALRNISQLAVEGVIASVVGASGATDTHRELPISGRFMASGAARLISISKEDNPPDAQQLLIDAVLFEDGSCEGDETSAAILEAVYAGRKEQEQRITDLIEKQLRNKDADDDARIESLQSQVAALSAESEPSLVNGVLERIPNPTDQQKQVISENVREGLELAKEIFLNSLKLYGFEKSSGHGPAVSLEQWWNKTAGQCDVLVASCSGNKETLQWREPGT